jgi:hypothetical protein
MKLGNAQPILNAAQNARGVAAVDEKVVDYFPTLLAKEAKPAV